ncbi:MAG: DUF3656 domain-containing protein [Oscillospiraceae bacterium]|nr:DUF3656 domain-containing protein [Oscillospiraceae bacterium]
MSILEILSPAGSPEAVRAAVMNGADAVYMGLREFNARRGAKNFTREEFALAAEYCRVRGVKTYATLNTLVTDREFDDALARAADLARLGADALIVADLGLVRALRRIMPDMPLHASTQMSIHSLDGVKTAAAMGLRRVVLARELTLGEIKYITENAPIETEVFVHGALCMSYSGQCYFSSVIGRRSGNRGVCAQPCRLPYQSARGEAYPLSLRDLSLVGHIAELEKTGVACLKIEGRMKRAEYTAIVTSVYSKAAHDGKTPSASDLAALENAFSRGGFTDGYLTGKTGGAMFGARGENERPDTELMRAARRSYSSGDCERVPVSAVAVVREDVPARLAFRDGDGNSAGSESRIPEPSFHRELTAATLETQLRKAGGTPFLVRDVKAGVDRGLFLTTADINELRREALDKLAEKRRAFTPPAIFAREAEPSEPGRSGKPRFTVSVRSAEQLSEELLSLAPEVVYIPAAELKKKRLSEPLRAYGAASFAVVLPRVITSADAITVETALADAAALGISSALCTNIGQIAPVRARGFTARGDFGLNLFNSDAVRAARDLGLASATLSFEMNLPQIRGVSKELDTEIIAYGRLPLMLTENCVVKSSAGTCACDSFAGLVDRRGVTFPVVRESGTCRTVVLNSQKLWLADKLSDFENAGLWALRLSFTTENAAECSEAARRYAGEGSYEPSGFTRGLYYKSVE